MKTIKKAQAGTSVKSKPIRDISTAEFKKYGNTESQLAGKKMINVKEQKNTPNAFVDYKAMNSKKDIAQKKCGGAIKKKGKK